MRAPIDLIILCGGGGRRLGGQDKGLLTLNGRSYTDILVERFIQPGDQLIISANRHLNQYQQLGGQVVTDLRPPGSGPLAGLEAALSACLHPTQLIMPCDMPWLPKAMSKGLLEASGENIIAVADDGKRLQPLCLAMQGQTWQPDLSAFLDGGGRSAYRWLDNKPVQHWRGSAIDQASFRNINTPEQLANL